jgi:hypothetical protein
MVPGGDGYRDCINNGIVSVGLSRPQADKPDSSKTKTTACRFAF